MIVTFETKLKKLLFVYVSFANKNIGRDWI